MADTAAHLVDRVLPRVPVRQWVLSLPYALRYRLAYDASLVTDVLAIFTRTVFASLIRRAGEFGAERKPQCGAVSFIQRFDSADSDPEESDSLRREEPWLAGLYAAAVSGRTAYGPNAGRLVTRVGDQIDPESMDFTLSPRCASVDGFSLHANVAVHAEDRPRLEDLQPNYNQVGPDRVAFNDDCACGASVARRERRRVAELRR
jgi:hypothetical protein